MNEKVASGLVSIMMPAYNAQDFISFAIQSVLAQTYANWELIIVDDGSADTTADIAAGFADPRIKVVRQANGGESVARNTALDHMSGEYIAFLDADDEFLPHHLEATQAFLAANHDLDGVYTDGFYCDSVGRRLQTLSSRRRGPFEGRLFEQLVRASDVFGPPICLLLRRHAVESSGERFDPEIVIGPDWDFTTRLSQHIRFGYVDEPTCLYRIHQTNITVRTDNHKRARHLARCREKAAQLEAFAGCSVETRSAVFYDLLVNLLPGETQRQEEILRWPQFQALPATEQARIQRLMASEEIVRSVDSAHARDWLDRSYVLDPTDNRGRLLRFVYRFSPNACSLVLRARRSLGTDRSNREPFQGLA